MENLHKLQNIRYLAPSWVLPTPHAIMAIGSNWGFSHLVSNYKFKIITIENFRIEAELQKL